MANDSNRGTQMFISPKELGAGGACQSDTNIPQMHHDNAVAPNKLQKRKWGKYRTEVGMTDELASVDESEKLLPVHRGSPWAQYKAILTMLDLGGEVITARKKKSLKRVGVRLFPRDSGGETLSRFRKLRHANIGAAVEAFAIEDTLYVILEEMHVSLEHVVRSPAFPSSKEIGTIMGQVLDGLAYLETNGFAHGSLSCDNILIHEAGHVKIANHNLSVTATSETRTKDMNDLGIITMKLMQKYTLDGGKVGVENPERWGDSDIIEFLSSITSSAGAIELREVGYGPYYICSNTT